MTDEPQVEEAADTPEFNLPEDRTIHQRLIAILGELPAIGKDQRNEQQKFMYRGHDDVMNALNPLLAEHGVYVVPHVMQRVTGERTTQRGSTMYEVNLHVRYRFYGAGGDYVEASAWGEGTDSGDKSTNKAMTMAFKNVLAQVFALATAELSDADAASPEETTRGQTQPSGRRQRTEGEQRPRREFDPGRDVAPGGIIVRTEDDATHLRQAQRSLDETQPWADIEAYLVGELFNKPYDDLDTPQKREFYTRMANAVLRVNELAGPGDFPPPTHEQIMAGYAWAFNGVTLALVPHTTGEAAPEPPDTPDGPQEANGEATGPDTE